MEAIINHRISQYLSFLRANCIMHPSGDGIDKHAEMTGGKVRARWAFLFGLVGGLLGAGVILLASQPPRGSQILLQPPPTPAPLMVYVSGAVMQPGVYQLAPGSRVKDALEASGGPAPKAELAWLNLAAHLEDGDQIWVPQTGENPASSPPRSSTSETGWRLVNLNTATVELLEELPGIGPVTAEKILAYREEHGPFQSIEEIQNVSGIGPATFERIKDLITVGPVP